MGCRMCASKCPWSLRPCNRRIELDKWSAGPIMLINTYHLYRLQKLFHIFTDYQSLQGVHFYFINVSDNSTLFAMLLY